jgi:hypothetical protein
MSVSRLFLPGPDPMSSACCRSFTCTSYFSPVYLPDELSLLSPLELYQLLLPLLQRLQAALPVVLPSGHQSTLGGEGDTVDDAKRGYREMWFRGQKERKNMRKAKFIKSVDPLVLNIMYINLVNMG